MGLEPMKSWRALLDRFGKERIFFISGPSFLSCSSALWGFTLRRAIALTVTSEAFGDLSLLHDHGGHCLGLWGEEDPGGEGRWRSPRT